jgi:hypothetical protein
MESGQGRVAEDAIKDQDATVARPVPGVFA